MSKKFKLAAIAVSMAMAGTLAVGMVGCKKDKKNNNSGIGDNTNKVLDINDISEKIVLKFDIGDKSTRSISYAFGGIISGTATLPDGKEYTGASLKPAWAALEKELNITATDVFSVASNKVSTAVNSESAPLSARDIITDGVDSINNNSKHFLDLNEYLDSMPNYKKFLEDNPVVQLSLTSDVETGAMYAAPYFDGYDDIEKYCLFKTNWVASLLDASEGASTTWSAAQTAKGTDGATHVTAFMGKTGSWNTDVLDKDGKKVEGGITVSYDKVIAALKDSGSALGAAVRAAGVSNPQVASGNIIDIQNDIIANGTDTGANLLKVMQEYIKVAYGDGFYAQSGYKLSDIFCGYSAAWDVDLLAALGRVMLANPSLLKSGSAGNSVGGANATALKDLYLVANRQGNMQRMIDTTSLVGELYGVRGLESRNMYSYLDNNGILQDVRGDAASYEAFNAFHALYQEGLVSADGGASHADTSHFVAAGKPEALMYHDYINTQTPTGYQIDGTISSSTYMLEEGYYFTACITPVSKWDTNGDGKTGADEYFRFTESWRSVKNTGFAVPKAAVEDDEAKLCRVLKFIDYLFSDDGQIAMTYGPMAENADGDGGFWYNRKATEQEVAAGTYFEYKGTKYYSDTKYAGKYVPTVTEKVLDLYVGKEVNGVNVAGNDTWSAGAKCARSYTDFSRYVIGSALPIGNKLQSLEYQMTSDMGKDGAAVVDTAISAGVIRHVVPMFKNEYGDNLWYMMVPTLLPYTQAEKELNTTAVALSDFSESRVFTNNSKATTNLYWEIIKNGLGASTYDDLLTNAKIAASDMASASAIISKLNGEGFYLAQHEKAKQDAWDRLYSKFA